MTTDLVGLFSGPLELVVDPALGGSIARFDLRHGDGRIPIFRGTDNPGVEILSAASFPLVPYVNRIRNGRFDFRGKTVCLKPNMAGDPSPIHGQGWLNPWRVMECTATEAILEYEHEAGEWPWSYLARQRFTLDPDGLTIELSCRNLSRDPMPCGLGLHPYFHCTPMTRLCTDVEHVWTIDDKVLPVGRVPATGRYDLADTAVCGLGLDHGFGGWCGIATISDPALPFHLIMSSPGTPFFQLYSPDAGAIFVIEPVTHANAALNEPEWRWEELGINVLSSAAEMTLVTRFDLLETASAR